MENDKDETIYNDLNMRGYVEAKFLKDFTFQANLAVDNTWAMRYRYISKLHGAGVSEKGAFGRSYTRLPEHQQPADAELGARLRKTPRRRPDRP
ncbi:MAG: hypothetical protein ACLR8Y_05850 [Alistipes indistinctus]